MDYNPMTRRSQKCIPLAPWYGIKLPGTKVLKLEIHCQFTKGTEQHGQNSTLDGKKSKTSSARGPMKDCKIQTLAALWTRTSVSRLRGIEAH